MFFFRRVVMAFAVLIALSAPTLAHHEDLNPLINALGIGKLKDRALQIEKLLKTEDERVIPVLSHLAEGTLFIRKSDKQVVLTSGDGNHFVAVHPLTQVVQEGQPKAEFKKIKVNNRLRRQIRKGLGLFQLSNPNTDIRHGAAKTLLKSRDVSSLELINERLTAEQNPEILKTLLQAKAAITLSTETSETEKLAAIEIAEDMGGRDAMLLLSALHTSSSPKVRVAAEEAEVRIQEKLKMWEIVQNSWYGLSLGSVLLLASIGLAITFGVMGVINMAHGEMVMIGAYTTYVVQEAVKIAAPDLLSYSLAIALPVAFLAAGAVGFIMERGIIRFLYGRPLETLLATWGVSLFLQQTVRTIFGPTNKEVINPSWMSGAIELGGLSLTLNRIWILLFAVAVFALLFLLLKRTHMGLQMRAVTQNRQMASSMGIKTPWVDAFTFALGSGIAGIAGVALSQIGNVSPNLGQTYIIDSFMVVVFGGVGNLWGTFIGALSLGVANKFMEPFAGAVLAKILILVFIILFIQKRPRGLFALKGRAAQS